MSGKHKNFIFLSYLDLIVQDLKGLEGITDKHEKELKAKSILLYWIGIIYDDGRVELEQLKVALDAARQMIEKLKTN